MSEEREEVLKKAIDEERKKNIKIARHNRKYNLLLYGIKEKNDENIYVTIKEFFKKNLRLSSDAVDQMFFANAHRLPSNGTGPKPIIVRFVRMFDRDLVLDQVYAGTLPKGYSILVDLPPVMKEQRYKLMQVAYKLRNPADGVNKLKTRILELNDKVILQVRKSRDEKWNTYDTSV
ncbi:uncharacterized protein LOC132737133 [Ruditapes philippinarum]|uniref:uncharacterized protein LOC132737133 n=1 Tax=Ruditapes philippinarum TaxID=129788 RepID=UPI00295AB272|nr:uncharacterized protein LOC132737133 [Ruditapes philippinarum]